MLKDLLNVNYILKYIASVNKVCSFKKKLINISRNLYQQL